MARGIQGLLVLLKLFEAWTDAGALGWETLDAPAMCAGTGPCLLPLAGLLVPVWSLWLAERTGAAHCLCRPFSDKPRARGHFREQGKQFSVQTNIVWHSLVLPPSSEEVCEGCRSWKSSGAVQCQGHPCAAAAQRDEPLCWGVSVLPRPPLPVPAPR